MQIVYSPTLPPGCCFICRASVRDSYVDTGVSHDYEGAYYICNICLGEMATMYSYMSFDEYKDLRQSNEELQRQNFELIKRLGELDAIHDALGRAGYKLSDSNDVVRVGGYTPKAAFYGEGVESTEGVELGVGEGETTEQSNDEGVGELHSDESSSNSEFSLDL